MSACRVGVVIATRDRRVELSHTLERLAALPERPQTVVVDNGSSDGTPGHVRRRHPDVEVLALGVNRGASARTVGARRLPCPYVAFSDDDSWWAPGALCHAERLLDSHPRLALVAARILVEPGARPDPVCAAMAASPLPRPPDIPGPPVLGFLACAAVVRRDALLAVGGFEPRFELGGEEELVAVDLAAAGWQLAYAEKVVAHHRPSLARDVAGRRRRVTRNGLWTAWLRDAPGLATRRSAQALAAALSDRGAAAGALDAARGMGWALRGRRSLPKRVRRDRRALAT